MSIYAPLVGNLWLTLESYGVDPREVIDKQIYRPGRSSGSNDRITFEDYDSILNRIASCVSDPAIGLRAAEYIHPSHLGALGYAWLASTTLRAAILRVERYSRMYNERLVMRVEELPDRLSASYHLPASHSRPHDVGDAHPAVLLKLCRINFGRPLQPLDVELQRPEPADPSPWLAYFGRNIHFGGRVNRLSISARDADTPLTGANEELVALNEEVLRRQLLKLDRHSILNRARLVIMEQLPSGRITEEELAAALNMSKRTLHRKLRENGETFRSLVKQLRMGLAEHYVGNDDYSITEIAFLLGFSDTSAFSRAFRNWYGQSPTQKREVDAEKRKNPLKAT
jgi:AraC-like DNA-binding protein